jgi:hypothetical protein
VFTFTTDVTSALSFVHRQPCLPQSGSSQNWLGVRAVMPGRFASSLLLPHTGAPMGMWTQRAGYSTVCFPCAFVHRRITCVWCVRVRVRVCGYPSSESSVLLCALFQVITCLSTAAELDQARREMADLEVRLERVRRAGQAQGATASVGTVRATSRSLSLFIVS